MILDYNGTSPSGYAIFKTPKPLAFIVKKDGMWTVFVLHGPPYIKTGLMSYFTRHCFSYHHAREEYKYQLHYFDAHLEHFKNWPYK